MPKWEDELERLKRDPAVWGSLTPSVRKALRTRGLVSEQGQIVEIEPLMPEMWRVQTWVTIGDKPQWVNQVSPTGETMMY